MFGIVLAILCFVSFLLGKGLSFNFVWNMKNALNLQSEDRLEAMFICFGLLIPVMTLLMMAASFMEFDFPLWVGGVSFLVYFFTLPFWLEYKVKVGRY